MHFAARFACRGTQSSCRPGYVELRFISKSQTWVLRDRPHTLRWFIDGKLAGYGGYRWSGEFLGADEVRETAELHVLPDFLESLVRARSIFIELDGDTTYSFSAENLSDVRELAAHMSVEPHSPPPTGATVDKSRYHL
jgi:hypothetical protein